MTNSEVAERLRKEDRQLRELIGNLRSQLSGGQTGSAAQADLRKVFEHLRAHMHRQMALAEVGGFLKEALESRPSMTADVDRLHREHMRVFKVIDALYVDLLQLKPDDGAGWSSCRARIGTCLKEIEAQEKAENIWAMEMFGEDIGAGD